MGASKGERSPNEGQIFIPQHPKCSPFPHHLYEKERSYCAPKLRPKGLAQKPSKALPAQTSIAGWSSVRALCSLDSFLQHPHPSFLVHLSAHVITWFAHPT